MLRGHSLDWCVGHVSVFFPGEGYPSTTGITADLVLCPVYCTKNILLLFQIQTYSCHAAKSLDLPFSCQNLLNLPHSSLRIPSSLAKIRDAESHQRHLPAASSDVCWRSSISDYAQISDLRVTLTCTHKRPPPKCRHRLAAFWVIQNSMTWINTTGVWDRAEGKIQSICSTSACKAPKLV